MKYLSLLRLYRNEQGQIVPLFILGVLGLVMLVVMILNTGHHISVRRKAQDAADAAAMTQASWIARSLNVMSMNNVALTQAFAINVITTALVPPLTEASARAAKKSYQYGKMIVQCAALPFPANLGCAAIPTGLLAHLTATVSVPLGKIWAENPPNIIRNFHNITIALENMNKRIVEEFPKFSESVQKELSEKNGLGNNTPLFYAGYEEKTDSESYSTSLPVEKVKASQLSVPLALTGTWGTSKLVPFYWNFQQHGYPRGKGPYIIGRDSANKAISKPIDALKGFPHGEKVKANFKKLAESAWSTQAPSRILLIPTHQITLYKIKNRPPPVIPLGEQRRDNWSLMAFTQLHQPSGAVLPKQFRNPPEAIFSYAQAEIYNDINYDLYTQDWRAKLVPAQLLSHKRQKVLQAIGKFEKLKRFLESIDTRELEEYNVH